MMHLRLDRIQLVFLELNDFSRVTLFHVGLGLAQRMHLIHVVLILPLQKLDPLIQLLSLVCPIGLLVCSNAGGGISLKR